MVQGANTLPTTPSVTDGQTVLTLQLQALPAGDQIIATTDLDDTIGAREITVRGSELAGAVLTVSQNGTTRAETTFSNRPSATVSVDGC